jgi:hypothetical protein
VRRDLKLKDQFETVLVVPLLAGADETEFANDGERRLVAGANGRDEAADAVALVRPVDQRLDGLGRVAMTALRREDP